MRLFFVCLLAPFLAGGLVYCLFVIAAAWRFRRSARKPAAHPPVSASLLKPLDGMEEGLERNLETFFVQDYPDYEILFAVCDEADAAIEVVERLAQRHPQVRVTLLRVGRSPYANAKVYSLERMAAAARSEYLVISDSDTFVEPTYLRSVMACFADSQVGVVTCVYRGVPGYSFWSRLEALAMTTELMPAVLLASEMEGMKFALGPTMAVKRSCLDSIGGFSGMADYLADDFVLGQWADRAGYRVVLSPYVVNHQVLNEKFWPNLEHRLRWVRSTRRSRPWGYLGQAFTYPVACALLQLAFLPGSFLCLGACAIALLLRGLSAWLVGWWVLRDDRMPANWWLVPIQDLLGFAVWCAGFAGKHVRWRGNVYEVERGGRFRKIDLLRNAA